MERELEHMARSEVLLRYDEAADICVRADYGEETYKHVLLPLYSTAYTYKGKHYRVLINGQSGRVEGDYPKSPVRIGAIVLLVILILAMVYWYSCGPRMQADTLPVWETEDTGSYETAEQKQEDLVWDYLEDSLPMW